MGNDFFFLYRNSFIELFLYRNSFVLKSRCLFILIKLIIKMVVIHYFSAITLNISSLRKQKQYKQISYSLNPGLHSQSSKRRLKVLNISGRKMGSVTLGQKFLSSYPSVTQTTKKTRVELPHQKLTSNNFFQRTRKTFST